MRPHVTDRDRLYLLRATSSSEVRNFLDRQPSRTKSDYQLLCEVLIKEFTDSESEHGLLTALSPFHTARWSRKIARKLPECLLCERKHIPGLIPGLIPGWGPSNIAGFSPGTSAV